MIPTHTTVFYPFKLINVLIYCNQVEKRCKIILVAHH